MRRFLKPLLLPLIALLFAGPALAVGIADISNKDAVAGLKAALSDGSAAAIGKLGAENGFFNNAKVRIPLPESLKKVEGMMRAMGMKRQADELELAMNRAAESAVTEAKPLLVDAVKNMSVEDAKAILMGGDRIFPAQNRRTAGEKIPAHREKIDGTGGTCRKIQCDCRQGLATGRHRRQPGID